MKTMLYVAVVVVMVGFSVGERAADKKAAAPGVTLDMPPGNLQKLPGL